MLNARLNAKGIFEKVCKSLMMPAFSIEGLTTLKGLTKLSRGSEMKQGGSGWANLRKYKGDVQSENCIACFRRGLFRQIHCI